MAITEDDFWNLCGVTTSVKFADPCPIIVVEDGRIIRVWYNHDFADTHEKRREALKGVWDAVREHLQQHGPHIWAVTELMSDHFEVHERSVFINARNLQDIAMDIQAVRDQLWKLDELPMGEVPLKAGELARELNRLAGIIHDTMDEKLKPKEKKEPKEKKSKPTVPVNPSTPGPAPHVDPQVAAVVASTNTINVNNILKGVREVSQKKGHKYGIFGKARTSRSISGNNDFWTYRYDIVIENEQGDPDTYDVVSTVKELKDSLVQQSGNGKFLGVEVCVEHMSTKCHGKRDKPDVHGHEKTLGSVKRDGTVTYTHLGDDVED